MKKKKMIKDDYISLGFKPIKHFTIGGNLIYDLGRNRQLSASSVGTPNETIFICQISDEDEKEITDLVCVHNWDYDKEMTEDKLKMMINSLVGS